MTVWDVEGWQQICLPFRGPGPVQPGCCIPAMTPSLQALEVCRLCHVILLGLDAGWQLVLLER